MKAQTILIPGLLFLVSVYSCNNSTTNTADTDSTAVENATDMGATQSSYVNLKTGEPVSVVKDSEKGYYVYSDSRKPIEADMFFVDVTTKDTLYGSKGVVVNNAVVKSSAGSWTLNEEKVEREGDEIKIKTADGKLKIEGDEIKYKEGEETKVKVDGQETKTKTADSKTKTDGAEYKSKTEDTKVKVDD